MDITEVIVRRDEHHKHEQRVADLERDVSELKRRLAAQFANTRKVEDVFMHLHCLLD